MINLKIFLISLATFFIISCDKSLQSGDICSVVNDSISFGAIKILAIEDSVIHIKLYRNKYYSGRPNQLNIGELTIDPDTANLNFGIPHLAITKSSFYKWNPKFILNENVTDEESSSCNSWNKTQINK